MKNKIKILIAVVLLGLVVAFEGCGGATYVGVGVHVPGAWGGYGGYGGYGPHGGRIGSPYGW